MIKKGNKLNETRLRISCQIFLHLKVFNKKNKSQNGKFFSYCCNNFKMNFIQNFSFNLILVCYRRVILVFLKQEKSRGSGASVSLKTLVRTTRARTSRIKVSDVLLTLQFIWLDITDKYVVNNFLNKLLAVTYSCYFVILKILC